MMQIWPLKTDPATAGTATEPAEIKHLVHASNSDLSVQSSHLAELEV